MLDRSDLSDLLVPPTRGKVRDVYGLPGDRLLFVASDRAGWMTGDTIAVDGGRHLTCLR